MYEVFARPRHATTAAFVRSAQHGEPDAALLEHLRARHPGRLLTLPVADGGPALDGLSELLRVHGVDFTFVHGGVAEVRGRPLGSVTLELRGEATAVEAVVSGLRLPEHAQAGVR
ncbi:hypothetical protein OG904_30855 [Streptomyces sp. NBC_00096]